jgi:putative tail fiber protein
MYPIETPDKTFHDGDGVSELGTILPAWWLNQIQGELLGVLELAGVAPNKTNTKQLKTAIDRLFTTKAAEATAGKADTKKLTTEDLNSLTFPGIYGQVLNINATTERNYPVQKAGSLLNMPSAYNSDNELASHQIYIPFDADEIWRRGKRNGGNWTEWSKLTVSPADLSAAIESSVPSGTVFHFAGQTAPAGWLKANGAAVSRTAYAALFAAIGTTYGAGDGRSTFNLPDLRGEFIRGWDDGRGIDRGRALGSAQGDAIRNITGSIDTGGQGGHQLFDEATATGALAISRRQWKAWTSDTQDGRSNPAAFDFDASRVVPTAAENRPRNIALLACIKI